MCQMSDTLGLQQFGASYRISQGVMLSIVGQMIAGTTIGETYRRPLTP